MDEHGKIVRPRSPTRSCNISPEDQSHIGLILSETKVTDKSEEKLLGMRNNEIVCALSSKTIYLSNSGQVISNIDLSYYWCNFCNFKTEDKHQLLMHIMDHRFSCRFCAFQTFSRVDVIRHMVQEHKSFEGNDLKFCVLLPDLLKHRMKQNDEKQNGVGKESQEKDKSKRAHEDEGEAQPLKRMKTSPTNENRSKTKKAEQVEVSRRPGRPKPNRDEQRTATNVDEDEQVTRRSTRANPSPETKSSTLTTPKFCFECSTCKYRTFQKPVLMVHSKNEHNKTKPLFSLKIVSRTQAKEIEENDGKKLAKLNVRADTKNRSLRSEKRNSDVAGSEKDSVEEDQDDDVEDVEEEGNQENEDEENQENEEEENQKNEEEGEKNEEEKRTKKIKEEESTEEEQEEEVVDTPMIEMDYAEEGDEDTDEYEEEEDYDDDDEDYVPEYKKQKSPKPYTRKQIPAKLKQPAAPQPAAPQPIFFTAAVGAPVLPVLEQTTMSTYAPTSTLAPSLASVSSTTSAPTTASVEVEPLVNTEEVKIYKCLLCQDMRDNTFMVVKRHYIDIHPGGTLIMSEMVAGRAEQWLYFCVGNNCTFKDANPLKWVIHAKVCQSEALVKPDGTNGKHLSLRNTASTVQENVSMLRNRSKESGRTNDAHEMSSIKQEVVDPQPEVPTAPTRYILNSEPIPISITQNIAALQTVGTSALTQSSSVTPVPVTSSQSNIISSLNPVLVNKLLSTNVSGQVPRNSNNSNVQSGSRIPTNAVSDSPNSALPLNVTNQSQPGSQGNRTVPVCATNPVPNVNHTGTPVIDLDNDQHQTRDTNQIHTNIPNTVSILSTSADNRIQSRNCADQTSNTGGVPVSTVSGNHGNRDSQTFVIQSVSSVSQNIVQGVPNHQQPPSSIPSSSGAPPATSTINSTVSTPSVTNKSTVPNMKSLLVSSTSSTPVSSTKTSSSKQSKPSVGENEPFDIMLKGNYKCAHCRFLGCKALEIRTHMVDRHRMNPLYGLDMMAEVKNVPRFLMFCPKDSCKFCTKGKDLFLKHLNECASKEDAKTKLTPEYQKRVEITRNFVSKTLQKLMSLTQ